MQEDRLTKALAPFDRWLGRVIAKTIAVLAVLAAAIAGYIAWGAWSTANCLPAGIAVAMLAGALWLARNQWRSTRKASDLDWTDVGPGSVQ